MNLLPLCALVVRVRHSAVGQGDAIISRVSGQVTCRLTRTINGSTHTFASGINLRDISGHLIRRSSQTSNTRRRERLTAFKFRNVRRGDDARGRLLDRLLCRHFNRGSRILVRQAANVSTLTSAVLFRRAARNRRPCQCCVNGRLPLKVNGRSVANAVRLYYARALCPQVGFRRADAWPLRVQCTITGHVPLPTVSGQVTIILCFRFIGFRYSQVTLTYNGTIYNAYNASRDLRHRVLNVNVAYAITRRRARTGTDLGTLLHVVRLLINRSRLVTRLVLRVRINVPHAPLRHGPRRLRCRLAQRTRVVRRVTCAARVRLVCAVCRGFGTGPGPLPM